MTIGERITKARTDAGLSKSALARAVGVTPSSVSQWESGTTQSVEGANLAKIAEACRVDAVWLATGRASKIPVDAPPIQVQSAEHPLLDIYQRLSPVRQAKLMALAYTLLVEESEPQMADSRGKRDNFEPRSEVRNYDRPKKGGPIPQSNLDEGATIVGRGGKRGSGGAS